MDTYKLDQCKSKFIGISKRNKLKLVYQWVKEKRISLKEFLDLIEYIENNPL